jgi:hypothetical protein
MSITGNQGNSNSHLKLKTVIAEAQKFGEEYHALTEKQKVLDARSKELEQKIDEHKEKANAHREKAKGYREEAEQHNYNAKHLREEAYVIIFYESLGLTPPPEQNEKSISEIFAKYLASGTISESKASKGVVFELKSIKTYIEFYKEHPEAHILDISGFQKVNDLAKLIQYAGEPSSHIQKIILTPEQKAMFTPEEQVALMNAVKNKNGKLELNLAIVSSKESVGENVTPSQNSPEAGLLKKIESLRLNDILKNDTEGFYVQEKGEIVPLYDVVEQFHKEHPEATHEDIQKFIQQMNLLEPDEETS